MSDGLSDETREELLMCLRRAGEDGDRESAHYDADMVLLDALRFLGEQQLVDEWCKIEKWYA